MISPIRNNLKNLVYRRLGIAFNLHRVPYLLGKHIENKKHLCLIDIGAHEGEFTRSIDRLCSVSKALLVEAQPERARSLASAFAAPRFEVLSAALSDSPGEMDLAINGFDATTSILSVRGDIPQLAGLDTTTRQTVRCQVRTLDAVAGKEAFPNIDLIKIDVQGAELMVLRGGAHTLKRTTMLWIEVSFVRLYEGACLFHEVHDFMTSQGFRLLELEPGYRAQNGELVQADALFSRI
jgi:FkbM family methyltransferase